jgi:hypothetical protein
LAVVIFGLRIPAESGCEALWLAYGVGAGVGGDYFLLLAAGIFAA